MHIQLEGLQYQWPGAQAPAIVIPALAIPAGQQVLLRGRSGSGKSTLLQLLTGVLQADQGRIQIGEDDLAKKGLVWRDRFRADHIGYIFQTFNLLPYLSVTDNVCLACAVSPLRKQKALAAYGSLTQAAQALLLQLDIPETLFNRPVATLSIGQQQRVAAARALIGQPDIVIADEPTSALDRQSRDQFIQLLCAEVAKASSTLLMVSHDEALSEYFSHCLVMETLNTQQVANVS